MIVSISCLILTVCLVVKHAELEPVTWHKTLIPKLVLHKRPTCIVINAIEKESGAS